MPEHVVCCAVAGRQPSLPVSHTSATFAANASSLSVFRAGRPSVGGQRKAVAARDSRKARLCGSALGFAWALDRGHAALPPRLPRTPMPAPACNAERYRAKCLHRCEHWLIIEAPLIAKVTSEVALSAGSCHGCHVHCAGVGNGLIAVA